MTIKPDARHILDNKNKRVLDILPNQTKYIVARKYYAQQYDAGRISHAGIKWMKENWKYI